LSSERFLGGSGLVIIVAPCPALDTPESPLTFVAITVTNTPSPREREYGEASSTLSGIVHYVAAMIELSVPSQFVESSVNVVPSD
jgi:hypothetical protein